MPAAKKKIRLLIVDDSVVFREVLSRGIAADAEIEVVAMAGDPFEARDKIIAVDPDVMVCDVMMPKMNGIEFIRRLLPQYPLRVVVVSSVTDAVLDAMNAGAVDFVAKPAIGDGRSKEMFIGELIAKIKIAANANIRQPKADAASQSNLVTVNEAASAKLIAIGASTGGTEAVFSILKQLPANIPGIVVVQHIPPVFSRMLAERLNHSTRLQVKEAESGDYVEKGRVLIAPGLKHLRIKNVGGRLKAETYSGEKVNGHCPSVDVLFQSVAAACGSEAVGVILTGMGVDGAKGLLAMRQKGARTLGQDKNSSVVYGMPKAAFDLGAVEKQVALEHMPQAIARAANG